MMPGSWPWGVIPIQEKEFKELTDKAEKLEAVKSLRRSLIEKYGEASNQLIRVHWIVSELDKILEAEEKE